MGPCEALKMRIKQNQCINWYISFRALLSPHRFFTASKMPWFGIGNSHKLPSLGGSGSPLRQQEQSLIRGVLLEALPAWTPSSPGSMFPLGTHCSLAGRAGHISVSHSPFYVSSIRWGLCLAHSRLPSNTSRRVIHSCYMNAETLSESSLGEWPVEGGQVKMKDVPWSLKSPVAGIMWTGVNRVTFRTLVLGT